MTESIFGGMGSAADSPRERTAKRKKSKNFICGMKNLLDLKWDLRHAIADLANACARW